MRRAGAVDLDAVVCLERESAEAAHWRREDYETMLASSGDWILVAENPSGNPAGFLAARAVAGEAEILNIAVEPAMRRRGAGRALLEAAVAEARERGARRLYLEVRATNEPARSFYFACGFAEVGRRPNYYQHPPEDAVVLARGLESSE